MLIVQKENQKYVTLCSLFDSFLKFHNVYNNTILSLVLRQKMENNQVDSFIIFNCSPPEIKKIVIDKFLY